jgi:hypothetical protein
VRDKHKSTPTRGGSHGEWVSINPKRTFLQKLR